MQTVYIVLIIVFGIIVLVFFLRERLKVFRVNLGGRRGNSEIHGALDLDADSSRRSLSTKVSNNIMKGKKQRLNVRDKGAEVEKNFMEGEDLQLNVDNSERPEKTE